eukprot:1483151-Rhodomonas_salina.4
MPKPRRSSQLSKSDSGVGAGGSRSTGVVTSTPTDRHGDHPSLAVALPPTSITNKTRCTCSTLRVLPGYFTGIRLPSFLPTRVPLGTGPR